MSLRSMHSMRQVLETDGPPLVGAVLVANAFFEFHSFALEFMAFLPVWFGLGWAYDRLLGALSARRQLQREV
ncbi:MAG: hypothetical protein M3Q23_17810 [Actinomycetota bacterium]|nr:hypothetical protein [Actinomycetota bacterium]